VLASSILDGFEEKFLGDSGFFLVALGYQHCRKNTASLTLSHPWR
jgi:hypothetical protein